MLCNCKTGCLLILSPLYRPYLYEYVFERTSRNSVAMTLSKKPRFHFGVLSTAKVCLWNAYFPTTLTRYMQLTDSYPLQIQAAVRDNFSAPAVLIPVPSRVNGFSKDRSGPGMDLCLDQLVSKFRHVETKLYATSSGPSLLTVFLVADDAYDLLLFKFRDIVSWRGKIVVLKHDVHTPSIFLDIPETSAQEVMNCVVSRKLYL